MKLSELNAISGPNYWSSQIHQIISLKITKDVSLKTNQELIDKLINRFPGLSSLSDTKAYDTFANFIGPVCIELQCLAGMPCMFHTFEVNSETDLYVAYEYVVEQAGLYAGEEAVKIITTLGMGQDYPVEEVINKLKKIKKQHALGATSGYILNEVKTRNIPIRPMNAGSLVALGHGCHQKKIRTAVADTTSGIGIEMAGDKEETKNILAQANVPVPKGIIVNSEQELRIRFNEVKLPVVIKPLSGNHGRGVTTHIYDLDRALFGYGIASKISEEVIVEEYIPGDDHRFLVINYKLVAVAKRSPAMITGDDVSTISKLIEETNKDPQRGTGDEHVLSPIIVDDVTKKILSENKLELITILKKGETLILKDTANISAGGTATDLTDRVHPQNKFMVERIARLFGLDICGVDIMTTGVDELITRETGAVIEVNAGPGIRMHSNPQNGIERNVAAPIIDMLFPKSSSFTVPIIAVAGSTHKTEIIQLIAKTASESGKAVGYNCSEGVFINTYRLKNGDCTDKKSMEDVLFDPMIELAILDCDDKSILNSGVPFKECDICIISDSKNNYINGVCAPIELKKVVANTIKPTGFAILNADDEDVLNLSSGLTCQIVLVSSQPHNEAILNHRNKGNIVGTIENDTIVIYHGEKKVISIGRAERNLWQNDDNKLIAAQVVNYILQTYKP